MGGWQEIEVPRAKGDLHVIASQFLDRSLERRDDASRLLVQRARVELSRVANERSWSQLERFEPDDDAVRQLLIDAGTRALEELLEQANEARP